MNSQVFEHTKTLWYNKIMIDLKSQAIKLREKGLTYSLIQKELNVKIPKSTLSFWFQDLKLSDLATIENKRLSTLATAKSRILAVKANKIKRQNYLDSLSNRYEYLKAKIINKDTALLALSMIYLGEGGKSKTGSVSIGNSDPNVIQLFLYLLNICFDIDKSKFRCTVQCRADQNTQELEKFWSEVSKIPLTQFYKTRIDSRTIGKPSRKLDYKGVCSLDYFSADIFNTIMTIIKIVTKGL
jgi:hypothetical protein